jgi:signal peptidase
MMVLLAFSVAITKLKSEDDIAHIFGIGFVTVERQTDGQLSKDLSIVRVLNVNEKEHLSINDTVSYYDLQLHAFTKQVITDINTYDQQLYYVTQQDTTRSDYHTIAAQDVQAVEVMTIKGLGSLLETLLTPKGFALGVLLPVVIIWILESMVLVNHLLHRHREKLEKEFQTQALLKTQEVESEFEAIRKQLLKNFNLE